MFSSNSSYHLQPLEGLLKLYKLFLKIPVRNCPILAELKLKESTDIAIPFKFLISFTEKITY